MKDLLKKALDYFIWAMIILLIVAGIGGCIAYDKERYHRKYPDTTSVDYFWDKIFHDK